MSFKKSTCLASLLSVVFLSVNAQVTDTGDEVGIGVSVPAHKLDVAGDINMNSGSSLRIGGSVVFGTPDTSNVHIGIGAGSSSTGNYNAFIGDASGQFNTSGSYNMFLGYHSGRFNTTGSRNLKLGYGAGLNGTTGDDNTLIGQFAGALSTTSSDNVFIGSRAGYSNTVGTRNTAIGTEAGRNLSTSNYNTFIGFKSGFKTTTGANNSFIGYASGFENTTASENTFIGMFAGYNSTIGGANTFIGDHAGDQNTTGSSNTYIGSNANGSPGLVNAVAIGYNASVTQDSSLVLGNSVKVGVGVSAPAYDLDVAGDINFTGTLYENGVPFAAGATGPTGPTGVQGATGPAGSSDTTYLLGGAPTGSITAYSGTTAPAGWLLCDGAELDRTAYADLFAVIGIAYGNGNGTTTFNLPDFRGRFMRGMDGGTSNDPDAASRVALNGGNSGDALGSYQADAFQGHHHNIEVTGTDYDWHENTGTEEDVEESGNNDDDQRSLSELAEQLTATTPELMTGYGAPRYSSETRPSNLTVNYIIKTGVGGTFGPTGPTGPAPTYFEDADMDTKIQVEENPDEDMVRFDIGGTERWIMKGTRLVPVNQARSVFIGAGAGANNVMDSFYTNVFIGDSAGADNTQGYENVAIGRFAMHNNVDGYDNVGIGSFSLSVNNTGRFNTAVGAGSLTNNFSGDGNTAIGSHALDANVNAHFNTAVGASSLYKNENGVYNTACGAESLFDNLNGQYNSAFGSGALRNNDGNSNTAFGYESLNSNTSGSSNTAMGYRSLRFSTAGGNTGVGYRSLYSNTNGDSNTASGLNSLFANVDGNQNTAIGHSAFATGTSYDNSTALGYSAEPGASNTIRLGNSSVSTIGGYANWTNVSDGRFKTEVNENVPGVEFISKLRPVTYHLDLDALAAFNKTPDSLRLAKSDRLKAEELQIGFIAQEVEEAAKALDFDFHGVDAPRNETSHYGLRYAEFVPPLVKAVQELNEVDNSLEAENESLRNQVEDLRNELDQIKEMLSRFDSDLQKCCTEWEEDEVNGLSGNDHEGASESVNAVSEEPILEQNEPNPFRENSVIKYYLPSSARSAELVISDLSGTPLKTFNLQGKGFGQVLIIGGSFGSGTYIYTLMINGKRVASRQMVML